MNIEAILYTEQNHREVMEIMRYAYSLSDEDRLIFLRQLQDFAQHESALE